MADPALTETRFEYDIGSRPETQAALPPPDPMDLHLKGLPVAARERKYLPSALLTETVHDAIGAEWQLAQHASAFRKLQQLVGSKLDSDQLGLSISDARGIIGFCDMLERRNADLAVQVDKVSQYTVTAAQAARRPPDWLTSLAASLQEDNAALRDKNAALEGELAQLVEARRSDAAESRGEATKHRREVKTLKKSDLTQVYFLHFL